MASAITEREMDVRELVSQSLDTTVKLTEIVENMYQEIDMCETMARKYQESKWSNRAAELRRQIAAIEGMLV